MILGLDASTSTVGYAFSDNGVVCDAGFIDISKITKNKEKAQIVVEFLKNNKHSRDIKYINLEGSLSGFAGPSSRTVVILLARWNAILEYALESAFGDKVNLVGAMTARKQIFGSARVAGMKPKEFVKERLEKMIDISPWEVKNKKNNVDKRIEDVRDAIVMSLYIKK